MMRTPLRLPILLAVSLFASVAHAQPASVEMSTNRDRVAVGETLVLRVRAEVRGDPLDDVILPDLEAFQVESRQVSRPFSFSFGFGTRGRVVQSTTEHVLRLRALEPGTHRLEPAQAVVGDRTFESEPLTIEVTGSADDAPAADGTPDGTPPSTEGPGVDGARFDSRAFLRTVVDEPEPYVGEQVTISVYLYVRGGLRSAPRITQEPSTDGFWVHDLFPPSRSLEATRQTVRGTPFRVYELRRLAAFPLRPGALTIGPMEARMQTGNIFRRGRPMEREGVPVSLEVRELPAPKPDGDVAVGRFHVEGELDRDTLSTGDAATLRVRVEGTGNLNDVRIEMPDLDGLRILSPQVETDIRSPNDVVGGTRTFEWLLVPERPGTYRIPSLGFHTFDPDAEEYGEARTEPITLEAVGRAVTAPSEGGGSDGERRTPVSDGDEARFGPLRADRMPRRAEEPLSVQPWYPAALAVPPLAWLAMLGGVGIRRRVRARGEARASARSLRRSLREARGLAEAGDARGFYAAIAHALTGALASRLDEPVGGFTHGELRRELLERGMEPALAGELVDELEGCDYARFSAAGVTQDEMQRCLDRSAALLDRLEGFRPVTGEDGS
ncbi:MAG: BatD family protein [Myxococcota bacterium]